MSNFYVSPSVSRTALNRFYSHFKADAEELHTLMIYENDALLVESASAPYTTEDKREIYSLSKSFCSTAIGFLIDAGKLSLDDRIIDLFPEQTPDVVSENLAAMRVRHVLSMNTGHAACVMGAMVREEDAVKGFLSQEVPYAPGTHFAYNTGATCLLSCIVEKITGMKLLDFLSWKLFMPLDITGVRWNQIDDGHNEGGCGIHVSVQDIAKLGLLYLHKGMWKGKRILSEEWVNAASSPISDNSCNGTPDWCAGYGYQFWVNAREGFRGDGAWGQLCVVLPKHNMVFALQTELGDMQSEMNAIMELADHIHDEDQGEPIVLPAYLPAKSKQKTAGIEQIWYQLDKNPMGFTGMSAGYDAARDAYRITFSTGCDQFILWAGDGHWEKSMLIAPMMKPKIVGLMSAKQPERQYVAASYEAEDGVVKLHVRYLNCPHRELITVETEGDRICVRFHAQDKLPPESLQLQGVRRGMI
ncbi:MAG: serine hydrolase [Clostridia bacterium]|nr:serine hydrolase [Clostridia bacterium]